jgi:hypothetical protein
MKPEWKDAPDWAQWLAMDADGTWFWFEVEPILTFAGFLPCDVNYGPKKRQHAGRTHFSETLEKRP